MSMATRPSRSGSKGLSAKPFVQRRPERLVDGGNGVAFARLDLRAVGLGFEIVDVNADGDDLVAVFEVGAAVPLEHQVRIARNLPRRAPDEPGGVFINDRSEGDFHDHSVLMHLTNGRARASGFTNHRFLAGVGLIAVRGGGENEVSA